MNKGELIDAVAAKAEVSQRDANAIVTDAIEAIMETVASGEKVTLVGFGSFEPRERKAREGRNPQTGKSSQDTSDHRTGFLCGQRI